MSLRIPEEFSEPATPAGNVVEIYMDGNDDNLKAIDDNGIVHNLSERGWRSRNLLINGGFVFAQRQAAGTLTSYATTANRVYGFDNWGMTIQTSSLQAQQIDTSGADEVGLTSRYYCKLKQITGAGKFMQSQVLSGTETTPLRGKEIRVQALVRFNVAPGGMTIRLGVIALGSGGTVDAVTNPWTTAFGANGVDPTLGANLTYLAPEDVNFEGDSIDATGVTRALTSNWARISGVFTVPAACKNIIPVLWSNAQLAVNDEYCVAEVGAYDGEEIRDWIALPETLEFQNCAQFYQKTFAVATAPAQNAGVTTGCLRTILGKAGATALAAQFHWRFPVKMYRAPTTNTTYNPGAANAQVRQISGTAADLTATAIANVTENSLDVTATGAAGGAVGDQVGVHVSADCSL